MPVGRVTDPPTSNGKLEDGTTGVSYCFKGNAGDYVNGDAVCYDVWNKPPELPDCPRWAKISRKLPFEGQVTVIATSSSPGEIKRSNNKIYCYDEDEGDFKVNDNVCFARDKLHETTEDCKRWAMCIGKC